MTKPMQPKTLVVKSSPGTSYQTLGKIKDGTVVKVYRGVPVGKDQDDWYSYQQFGFSKIKYKNKLHIFFFEVILDESFFF